jgi:hypothetical protein
MLNSIISFAYALVFVGLLMLLDFGIFKRLWFYMFGVAEYIEETEEYEKFLFKVKYQQPVGILFIMFGVLFLFFMSLLG